MSKIVYPRTCSASGEGVYEGYLCEDGTIFKYEKDLIHWIKSRRNYVDSFEPSDEFLLDESHQLEEYFWTTWSDDVDNHDDVYQVIENMEVIEPIVIDNSVNDNIIKFMYYANNFNHDWIDKVWSDNSHMAKHLTSKWIALNRTSSVGGTMNFFKLFMQLDNKNRNKLCNWISENYKG